MAKVAKRTWVHAGTERTAWVVRYMSGGKHRSKQFEKKRDADAFRVQMESEVSSGIHVPQRESATVADVVREFLRAQDVRLEEKRLGRSRHAELHRVLTDLVVPVLGAVRFAELRFAHVEQLYEALRGQGRQPIYIKMIVGMFKQVEDFARKRDYTRRQVVQDVMRDHRGVAANVIRQFTYDEAAALLKASAERAPWMKQRTQAWIEIAVHLAAFCGLRYGEIMGLTVESVSLAERTIHVRHSLTLWDELKAPKTSSGVRDVPMPAHVAALLTAWIESFYTPNPRRLLIRRETGNAITNPSFQGNNWRPLLKRAGLEPLDGGEWLHFHALRHFAASSMIDHGLPVTDVAGLLGHRKFDMTLQVYAHPIASKGRRSDATERLAARLNCANPAQMPTIP